MLLSFIDTKIIKQLYLNCSSIFDTMIRYEKGKIDEKIKK